MSSWKIRRCSGSSKSSLAFDTLYAEGQRRYVESLPSYAPVSRVILDKGKLCRIIYDDIQTTGWIALYV